MGPGGCLGVPHKHFKSLLFGKIRRGLMILRFFFGGGVGESFRRLRPLIFGLTGKCGSSGGGRVLNTGSPGNINIQKMKTKHHKIVFSKNVTSVSVTVEMPDKSTKQI